MREGGVWWLTQDGGNKAKKMDVHADHENNDNDDNDDDRNYEANAVELT